MPIGNFEINISTIATWLSAVTAIIGMGGWLISTIKKAAKPFKDINQKIEQQSKAFDEKLNELNKSIDILNESMIITLRKDIVSISLIPFNEREISKYDLQVLFNLYDKYKSLGGNRYIDELIADIRKLKVKQNV